MFYDTLLHLCALNGKKITNVIAELNLSGGNPSKWKSGNIPKADTLTKLADYFHVSVDYLLGRDSVTGGSILSSEEREVLTMFSQLNPSGREYIMTQFDYALSRDEYIDRSHSASDKSAV